MTHQDDLFQKSLREFGPALARLASTYEREPARAEDLYQEICLALWKALPSWRQDSSLRTFVYRIAHNRGLTHGWREGKRNAEPLPEVLETRDPTPNAEERVDHRQRLEHLQVAVRRLPLGLRQAVSLKLEGLSAVEIGEILDLSPGNVRVRLHRAQKLLAESLPKRFQSMPDRGVKSPTRPNPGDNP